MEIRTLETTPLEEVIDCLLKAFAEYFVKFPTDLDYWRSRFRATGVDWRYSYGVFDRQQLVAFIIHGIGEDGGKKTAFNTGTGVLPAYRKQSWVDKIYEAVREPLRAAGIQKGKLEVITENKRAIRVYERIGFHISRRVQCFSGDLAIPADEQLLVQPTAWETLRQRPQEGKYSWDHTHASLARVEEIYVVEEVLDTQGEILGWYVLNPTNGYLAQIESPAQRWEELFGALRRRTQFLKINNVAEERTKLIQALQSAGLNHTVDQFEMEMDW